MDKTKIQPGVTTMTLPNYYEMSDNGLPEISKSLKGIPVRFFIYDEEIHNEYDNTYGNYVEATEQQFMDAPGTIEYERNTVFANGVSQICLTKNPF